MRGGRGRRREGGGGKEKGRGGKEGLGGKQEEEGGKKGWGGKEEGGGGKEVRKTWEGDEGGEDGMKGKNGYTAEWEKFIERRQFNDRWTEVELYIDFTQKARSQIGDISMFKMTTSISQKESFAKKQCTCGRSK